jgi:DNA polymerase
MNEVIEDVVNLKESPLYDERMRNGYVPVIGDGSLDAHVMLIGEAPGRNEAASGKPFCGASGKVLDHLLACAGMSRTDVYVTNIIKDRPAGNRDPKPEEVDLYAQFLIRQIEIIQPRVIATLGRFSMGFIFEHYGLGDEMDLISKVHGKIFKVHTEFGKVLVVPLFHPAVAIYDRKRMSELEQDAKMLGACL